MGPYPCTRPEAHMGVDFEDVRIDHVPIVASYRFGSVWG